MGNIDFRTGDLTGKLGGLVGARWKQSPYTRRYVIPANPQTSAQMATRDSWAMLVGWGRRINSTILKLFVLPKPKGMSPFNRFMQFNQWFIDTNPDVPSALKISEGGLYAEPITSAVSSAAAGTCVVTFPTAMQGEALASDLAIIVVWNATQDTYGFSTTEIRSAGVATVTLAGDLADEAHVWMFFAQGIKITSPTKYITADYVA